MTDKKQLNPKHQAFVDEYIIDFNASEAAKRAGYSGKTARTQGSKLLTNIDIQQAVRIATEKRSERTKVDADWVLTHLSNIVKADPLDILDKLGDYKKIEDWPLIWRQMLNAVDIQQIRVAYNDDEQDYATVVKTKFMDKMKALELTGKHVNVNAFKERVGIDGELKIEGIKIKFVGDDDE